MPGFERAVLSSAPDAAPASCEAAAEPITGVVAAPLSKALWGVDLKQGLPRVLSSDGIVAVAGELSRVREFVSNEFPSFQEESLGGAPNVNIVNAKRCYFERACDFIELQHDGRTIGVLIGDPEDWSTYYIRVYGIVQAYQRPALVRRFIRECLFERLALHHVERVVAETSPANLAMARTFSEQHFHVTGHQLSDRWGPLVRYTKFLDPAREAAFLERFPGSVAGGGTRARKEGQS